MKKIISLILVLCLCVALAACGGGNNDNGGTGSGGNNDGGNTGNQNEPGYTFTHNGTQIAMNVKAESIITALGEPVSYTEEPSCAFSGLDKTYNYGSFVLQTYPDGDVDYIYCLWLVDDSVSTSEGVYIGATKAEVEAAYGAAAFNGTNAYVLTKGACTLSVILEGDVVSSITYDAVLD